MAARPFGRDYTRAAARWIPRRDSCCVRGMSARRQPPSSSSSLFTRFALHRSASSFQPHLAARSPSKPSAASRTKGSSSSPASPASPAAAASPAPSTTRDPGLARRVAQTVRDTAPTFTETYVAYGATEQLVKECVRPVAYSVTRADEGVIDAQNARGEEVGTGTGWWYGALGLDPTFNNWAQVSLLHMWLVTVRLRAFPASTAGAWHQHLINHFFFLAEDRLATTHRIAMKSLRQRALKDLFTQWRGLTVAYDEGLLKGDAVLAAAVWRNVTRADPTVNLARIAEVVAFMRSVLRTFDGIDDEDFARADIVFGDPGEEADLVKIMSRGMNQGAVKK